MPERIPLCVVLLGACALGGCRQDMHDQPKYKAQQASRFFADGRSQRPVVQGTIARGHLRGADREYMTGRTGLAVVPAAQPVQPVQAVQPMSGKVANAAAAKSGDPGGPALFDPDLVTEFPIPITREVLLRGRERFNIFCTPCHGYTGSGNGMIVRRGFTPPPSYHIQRLKDAPVGHFFDVMTNGYGAMYSYAARVSVADRWAIAAYIRVLQLSQGATAGEIPADVQTALTQGKQIVDPSYTTGDGNKRLGGLPTLGSGLSSNRSETHTAEEEHK
jgi:hypothetical protein